MVAYVHIEYSTHQFSEETKGGWIHPPPPGPCGTEKSVVLRGLNNIWRYDFEVGGCTFLQKYKFAMSKDSTFWVRNFFFPLRLRDKIVSNCSKNFIYNLELFLLAIQKYLEVILILIRTLKGIQVLVKSSPTGFFFADLRIIRKWNDQRLYSVRI